MFDLLKPKRRKGFLEKKLPIIAAVIFAFWPGNRTVTSTVLASEYSLRKIIVKTNCELYRYHIKVNNLIYPQILQIARVS